MPATGPLRAAAPTLAVCPLSEADAALSRRPAGWPLSARETAAFEALATPKRRREWLAGRLAAKRALAGRLGQAAPPFPDIEIANDASGRPFCASAQDAALSISHGGDLAVCALSENPIGVDCEPIATKPPGALKLIAAADELSALDGAPLAQTRLWCAKEAVLKLLGLGLSCDPRDVRLNESGVALSGAARERWRRLGAPPIILTEHVFSDCLIVVACTGGRDGEHPRAQS